MVKYEIKNHIFFDIGMMKSRYKDFEKSGDMKYYQSAENYYNFVRGAMWALYNMNDEDVEGDAFLSKLNELLRWNQTLTAFASIDLVEILQPLLCRGWENKYKIIDNRIWCDGHIIPLEETTNCKPNGREFPNKESLLDYIVWLTSEVSNYDQLGFDVVVGEEEIGIVSNILYLEEEGDEVIWIDWTQNANQTYYKYDRKWREII